MTVVAEECGRDPKPDREMMPKECEPLQSHKGSDIELEVLAGGFLQGQGPLYAEWSRVGRIYVFHHRDGSLK